MSECVGCGYCCIKVPCGVAVRLHGSGVKECPSLTWNGSRYVCGLMVGDSEIARRYREELSAGAGCCSGMNSWRREEIRPRRPKDGSARNYRSTSISSDLQAFLGVLGTQFISGDAAWLAFHAFKSQMIREGVSPEDAKEMVAQMMKCYKEGRPKYVESFIS